MKWLLIMVLPMVSIQAQNICGQNIYNKDELIIFKDMMRISNIVLRIVQEQNNKSEQFNKMCREKKWDGGDIFHASDLRTEWPSQAHSAEESYKKTSQGFLLEFHYQIPAVLWSPWGKLPLVGTSVGTQATWDYIRNRIVAALGAIKFNFENKTMVEDKNVVFYRLTVIKKFQIRLPVLILSEKRVVINDDFLANWDAMNKKYREKDHLSGAKIVSIKHPRRTTDMPANRKERYKIFEKIEQEKGISNKPVKSLMHLMDSNAAVP